MVVLSANDAIMFIPTELQLHEDEEDPDSHASKKVRLASASVIVSSDPYGPPPGPPRSCPFPLAAPPLGLVSSVRTAPPSLPLAACLSPSDSRKRVTGKKPPVKCNQWGTMCQVFDMSPRAEGSHSAFEHDAVIADVESSTEVVNADASGASPPTGDSIISETLSSVESMDEDPVVSSAEAVRAVPNVKAAASLKPSSKLGPKPSAKNPSINLSPQQKRNLAKKLRKQAGQSAAA